ALRTGRGTFSGRLWWCYARAAFAGGEEFPPLGRRAGGERGTGYREVVQQREGIRLHLTRRRRRRLRASLGHPDGRVQDADRRTKGRIRHRRRAERPASRERPPGLRRPKIPHT